MKYIERKSYKGGTEIVICATEVEQPEAKMAMELMKHLAIIAGAPDGVDEAGRQKLRLMTEREVVMRASKIAALAWAEFRRREWILDIPLPKIPETEIVSESEEVKVSTK